MDSEVTTPLVDEKLAEAVAPFLPEGQVAGL